jgi:hypothetical protein
MRFTEAGMQALDQIVDDARKQFGRGKGSLEYGRGIAVTNRLPQDWVVKRFQAIVENPDMLMDEDTFYRQWTKHEPGNDADRAAG